jgi:transposase
VALESSGTYGDALVYQLQQVDIAVYQVSAKRCHDAAELYDGVPSMHDAKAADIIARMHLDGLSKPWRPKSLAERELAAAVRVMEVYDRQYHQLLNRLEAQLARHWPEVTEILELSGATLLALLHSLGGPQALAAHSQAGAKLMRKVGGHYLVDDKIAAVLHSAQRTIGVPMTPPEAQALQQLAQEANRCRKEATRAKQRVQQLSGEHPTVQQLAQTVGATTAAVLVVSSGDPQQYPAAGAYVKSLGLNLKERSSGKHKGELKLTKRGPSTARHYLYMAALRLVQHDQVAGAWYGRKVQRDGGKAKKKAVVALMRKLAGALWHVARGADFDSQRLFDTRRLGLQPTG